MESTPDANVERTVCDIPADLSTVCLVCNTEMAPEHAHYRCPRCGWRDSCCDGPY